MSSIDMERFREDINRYRRESDVTWAALAEKAGVSPAMFTRIKKGSAVTLEAFAQLCSSFQLNPIDYMPELQTKPTKEQPMEDVKRLSVDGKDFTIGGSYTGTQLMEYSAKGNLQGGNAKKYTIKDAGKISYTLAVGDYFCADGSLVSKDAETVPANVVGIVAYTGNPQPHVMTPDACSDVQDALFRDYPSASHGLILALNNAALEDGSTTSQYHSGKSGTYDTWFDDDAEWAGKFVYCNTSRNGSLKNDVLAMYPAFFGYNNTVLMTMVTEEGKGSPSTCDYAYKFIQAYRSAVELPVSASPWYLPSAKELQQVADNLSQLNSSLTKAGGQELVSTTAQSGHYWTSVLRSEVYQWTHGMEGGLYTVLAERGSRAGQFRMMAAF